MSVRLNRAGAYSEMYSAVPVASGTAMTMATEAISTVPTSTAATPKFPEPGSHASVVRNENSATSSACQARWVRSRPPGA